MLEKLIAQLIDGTVITSTLPKLLARIKQVL
jgi:hypothetical protein